MFKTFQSKMILFFTLLFILGQITILCSVYYVTRSYMIAQAEEKLVQASEVFKLRMASRIDYLRVEANLLSSSYLVKQALTQGNNYHLKTILTKIAFDMGYNQVVVMKKNGQVLLNLFKDEQMQGSFPFKAFMSRNSENKNQTATILVVNNHVYEFVMVPLKMVMTDGSEKEFWLGIGSELVDDTLAKMKAQYTFNLDILVRIQDKQKKWQPLASSLKLSSDNRGDFLSLEKINDINIQVNSPIIASLKGTKYIVLPVKFITSAQSDNFQIILMYQFSKIMSGVYQLMTLLIIIFLIGLGLTILCAWLLGRRIAEPINKLSTDIKNITHGKVQKITSIKTHDEVGRLSKAFNNMIETIKDRENTINYQFMHDLSTKLPNHRFFRKFSEKLLQKLSQQQSKPNIALLFIGLSRIKEINHTFGHEFSTALKVKVAERLHAMKMLSLVSHFSSNEFVLVIQDYKNTFSLEETVKSISRSLEQPYQISQANVDINAYIGVCEIQIENKDINFWVRNADHAHYVAKKEDLKYLFYHKKMDRRGTENLSLMGELVQAINHDQLLIYYQPKVSFKVVNQVDAEALIRWKHKKYGYLSPQTFIPLAEQTGHINKLTEWVITQVIKQLSQFKQQYPNIRISVNVSAKDLINKDFVPFIQNQLACYQILPGNLVLEITEGAVMNNPHQGLKILHQLKKLGVILSIDDFGTGYSSMEYLKKLPIQEMKIDQSFVKQMHQLKQDALIVQSLINLAHNLKLKIIAEGVLNQEIEQLLKSYGCDYGQGYYYSPALPPESFKKWLNDYLSQI